ncbi:NLR family CARD domain-containing protein 3-like [Conger conger]|uniref:NLR family CARD domain-containing protein 3-like n=1 Tax=Conger conger TaxID=82655 RepID=UPI002A5A586D|nr:NLR family CARD domain-containing protein 3-like [Conger conger]
MEPPLKFRREDTEDQRVQVERAGSPVPSCLSMKSDCSMKPPLNFRGEVTGDQRVQVEAGSPVPSCVSMKSDCSMKPPLNFRGEVTGDQRVQVERAGSPVPSCLSMKSDRSMDLPLNFRGEVTGDQRVQVERAGSPVPSCVSMKSDCSMKPPLNFRGEVTGDQRVQVERAGSPVPSCLSMKSDCSMKPPLNFRGEVTGDQRVLQSLESSSLEDKSSEKLSSPKQSLLNTLVELKKNGEFKPFQSHLSQDCPECFKTLSEDPSVLEKFMKMMESFTSHQSHDYPDCSEREQEDPELLYIVEKMLETCGSERSLKITLHILRNMKQKDLAYSLEREQCNESIKRAQQELKTHLKKKFEYTFEGLAVQGHTTLLNEIYTELYITEGGSGGVNNEHEVRQIETASKRQTTQETPILCNDIFKPLPGQEKRIRTVLTKGIAGIGKTVSVQKFILDWAEGKANQDMDFIFTLPFRDLNLKKEGAFSLMQLLQHYFPQLKEVKSVEGDEVKVVFVFDGLDECRLPLHFQSNEICCDITESSSVDVLLTNLIKGNLLPSALLWITSRPAAANRIPPECIHQVTEVRGFNDPQKEEYFRKRIRDQNQASRIISHIQSSRSLYIMCHIPVFCWISATVLETMLGEVESGDLPKTLTEMYTHFLLIQTNVKNLKYRGSDETNPKMSASDTEIILKLGQLAFQQLEKGNLIFYEEDLRDRGIDVSEASVHSGVCTEIFKEERGLGQEKVYCFVHLSIQEYLAALFAFHSCVNENRNLLRTEEPRPQSDRLSEFRRRAVDQALESENTHPNQLSGFRRRAVDQALESENTHPNQLSGFRRRAVDQALESENGHGYQLPGFHRMAVDQALESENTHPYQLSGLHWSAVGQALESENGHGYQLPGFHRMAVDQALESENTHPYQLSGLHWSAVGQALNGHLDQLSGLHWSAVSQALNGHLDQLSELHRTAVDQALRSKNGHLDLFLRFLLGLSLDTIQTLLGGLLAQTGSGSPVPDHHTQTESRSRSTRQTVQYIKEKLKSESSAERTINLFHCLNELNDNSAVEEIQNSLRSGQLSHKELEPHQCSALAFVLLMSEEVLDEFDLKTYKTSEAGHHRLVPVVRYCRKAILHSCNLSEESCEIVASALQSSNSPLRDLDLSSNTLGDAGVKLLCAGLMNPNCKLQRLGLVSCDLREESCEVVASALQSSNSPLRDLDLSYNNLGDSGVKLLCAGLMSTNCKLQRLGLSGCRVTQRGCDSLASALRSNPSHLRELDLRYNHPGDSGVRALFAAKLDTLTLLVEHGGENRIKPGPRKYGCLLTLDPNTAYRELSLSEGNRKVTRAQEREEPYPDHPERFESKPQVLCRESLCACCYWEAEYNLSEGGGVDIAVTYKGISRKGGDVDCEFGLNENSWSLWCDEHRYSVWHNNNPTDLPARPSPYHRAGVCDDGAGAGVCVYRVGVCVDRLAGTLSFYSVSDSDTLTLLHTLHTHFTQHTPLYAGFKVGWGSVSLCQLE